MRVALEEIEAARAGDAAARDALVGRVWPDAYRIAFSVVHDRQMAEDAAQEACAHLLVSLGRLRDAHAFRTWFYRTTVNAALSEARRRSPSYSPPEEGGPEIPAPAVDIDLRTDLRRAVADLDPLYRVPLVLRYMADLSSAQIGQVLGLPAGTVRFRLSVARDRLRARLAPDAPPSRERPGPGDHRPGGGV